MVVSENAECGVPVWAAPGVAVSATLTHVITARTVLRAGESEVIGNAPALDGRFTPWNTAPRLIGARVAEALPVSCRAFPPTCDVVRCGSCQKTPSGRLWSAELHGVSPLSQSES